MRKVASFVLSNEPDRGSTWVLPPSSEIMDTTCWYAARTRSKRNYDPVDADVA